MPKKRKILYLVTKGNQGGAQSYVYDLAMNLPEDRFDVVVAFGEGNVLGKKLTEGGKRTIQIPTLLRDVNPHLDFRSFFALLKIFRAEKPEIIHLNSSKIGGIGAFAARVYNCHIIISNAFVKLFSRTKSSVMDYKLPIKIVFTGHGWAFNERRSIISRLLILFFHWLTILLSHRTIAVSEKTAKDVSWMPFAKKKIALIYNGLKQTPLYSSNGARDELRLRIPDLKLLPKDTTWIGTISELHPNKGLDLAIAAMGKVTEKNSVAFVIIGDGERRSELEMLVQKMGLRNSVFLPGRIENARTLIPAFDIVTLTSRTEALPYTLLEAGFAGTCVVASAVGGIPEIIDDMRSGIIIKPNDVREIERALSYAIENPEKRKVFGAALKESVKDKFSFEKMLQKTAALYDSLAI